MQIVDLSPKALDKVEFSITPDAPFMVSVDKTPISACAADLFSSTDKKVHAGLSAYKKVTLKVTDWPVDEVMILIEGQVEIPDGSGHAKLYKAGDALVMPKGFSGTWRQLTDIRKIQLSYSPK